MQKFIFDVLKKMQQNGRNEWKGLVAVIMSIFCRIHKHTSMSSEKEAKNMNMTLSDSITQKWWKKCRGRMQFCKCDGGILMTREWIWSESHWGSSLTSHSRERETPCWQQRPIMIANSNSWWLDDIFRSSDPL